MPYFGSGGGLTEEAVDARIAEALETTPDKMAVVQALIDAGTTAKTNHIGNPNFPVNLAGWDYTGTPVLSLARVADAGETGGAALVATQVGAASTDNVIRFGRNDNFVPCVPGQSFNLSIIFKISAGGPGILLQARFLNAEGGQVTNIVSSSLYANANAWNAHAASGTVPATAARVALEIYYMQSRADGALLTISHAQYTEGSTSRYKPFSGDSPGGYWTGTRGASSSIGAVAAA